MATAAIVTRDNLRELLLGADEERRMHIIGRALVVLYNRQTADEKRVMDTKESNGIGFAGCDAKQGSYGAQQYIRTQKIDKYQVQAWMRMSRGAPRICKYNRQLNEAAVERAGKVAEHRAALLAQLEQQYTDAVHQGEPALIADLSNQVSELKKRMGI